ncbi:hypothetical protein [Amycolatopsis sp. FDAARGOS 1241]|nr:hypothetical protein [Amycolatopsis sp. FDAARGOS 1241]
MDGRWPDGGYTTPTGEALALDLRHEKALGFKFTCGLPSGS